MNKKKTASHTGSVEKLGCGLAERTMLNRPETSSLEVRCGRYLPMANVMIQHYLQTSIGGYWLVHVPGE